VTPGEADALYNAARRDQKTLSDWLRALTLSVIQKLQNVEIHSHVPGNGATIGK